VRLDVGNLAGNLDVDRDGGNTGLILRTRNWTSWLPPRRLDVLMLLRGDWTSKLSSDWVQVPPPTASRRRPSTRRLSRWRALARACVHLAAFGRSCHTCAR
jgi:hypothetical protein